MSDFSAIIGQSPALEAIIRSAKLAASTDVTVLLKGDTGTGKEIFAHAIKNESQRANNIFLALNCGALPESLIESELFGHKKGAFTGATQNTQGLLQVADGGTLFLDEINSLPLSIQTKLLRFLDVGECLAVGEVKPYKVDVRIIAATNADLTQLISKKLFRSDLYYRLNVVPFELPRLADRTEDIEPLSIYFFQCFEQNHGATGLKFSKTALKALKNNQWLGNIRELRNLCERLSILYSNKIIELEDLPPEYQITDIRSKATQIYVDEENFLLPFEGIQLDALEVSLIKQALYRTHGNRTKSAKLLGISRDTLIYRMQKHGLL